MPTADAALFSPRGSAQETESGKLFSPRFDAEGLIAAIVTDAAGGEVLMFAWMNEEALAQTIGSGLAHFWSRSRKRLWRKGEESGNQLRVVEMRTDCDQDVVWLKVEIEGDGLACHTGRRSCFYRRVPVGSTSGPLPLEHVQVKQKP
jgi:phosphoribosyl-AMP cyclohydrolase